MMFEKKYKRVIVVHNDEVCWIGDPGAEGNRQFFRLPLEQVLNDESTALQMPEWLKGSAKTLCIFPDHWFGCSTYPFQSRKPSLIEPFLERKLTAANPGQKSLRHFFNYRHVLNSGTGELFAFFLQEDNSFRLYNALHKLNHAPQRITSPAFLWEERLQRGDQDFSHLGTLLIHIAGQECQLYFYYQGKYQFSRSVMLSDASDRLEALGFEINQSLYMFSQKAKSELDRIYLVCDAAHCRDELGQTLGREITDLHSLTDQWTNAVKIPEMAPLDGLLQPSQMTSSASFFSVIHRQVKRAMEWRPVQLAGIVSGLILLLGLTGENILLGRMLAEDQRENQSIQQSLIVHDCPVTLSESADTLDQVLNMAAQSALAEKVFQLPEGFAPQMKIKKLDLALESPPKLKLSAFVQARSAEELTLVLTRLINQMKAAFKGAQALSLNDIDISLDLPGDRLTPNRYQIEFQLELT
jgi:hypothetical protein